MTPEDALIYDTRTQLYGPDGCMTQDSDFWMSRLHHLLHGAEYDSDSSAYGLAGYSSDGRVL